LLQGVRADRLVLPHAAEPSKPADPPLAGGWHHPWGGRIHLNQIPQALAPRLAEVTLRQSHPRDAHCHHLIWMTRLSRTGGSLSVNSDARGFGQSIEPQPTSAGGGWW
jgi:hypothetical protein